MQRWRNTSAWNDFLCIVFPQKINNHFYPPFLWRESTLISTNIEDRVRRQNLEGLLTFSRCESSRLINLEPWETACKEIIILFIISLQAVSLDVKQSY